MRRLLVPAAIAALVLAAAPAAQAVPINYVALLDGPSESPPNASPGTGTVTVVIDTGAHTLHVVIAFADLLGTTTAAHIHAPTAAPLTGTAGVATTVPTFAGFPLGVTSGSYDMTLDLTLASSFNPAYVTANGTVAGAEAALSTALMDGKAYLNIHTTVFPGGEIRGFLQAPEPGTLAMLGFGIAALAWRRRGRVTRAR